MPLMNQRGDVIMGAGGVQGSLNGRTYPFETYGRGVWVDDDTIIVSSRAEGAMNVRWHPGDAHYTLVQPVRGANSGAGGGGQWIALGEVPDGTRDAWLYGSIPDLRYAGGGHIAPDGTIAFKTIYQSYGGITIIPPGSSRPTYGIYPTPGGPPVWPDVIPPDWISVPSQVGYGLFALPGGKAIWNGGAYGREPLKPYFEPLGTKLVTTTDGTEWLLYWSNVRSALVLQPNGAAEGFILEERPVAFDGDIIADGNDVIVTTSWGAGEGPNELVKLRANRAGVTYLVDVDPHRVVPQWQSFAPPPRPPKPTPTFRFDHKAMVALFKDPEGATTAPVEIVVNKYAQAGTRPVFIADDTPDGLWNGPLFGVYTEKRAGTGLEVALARATALNTRLLACHDSREPWVLQPGLRPYDVPVVELYRHKTPTEETLEQARARWSRDVDAMLAQWKGDCGVCPQYYCMGGALGGNPPEAWPVEDVLDTHRFLSELVNRSSRIKIIAPFSYLRANGIVAHPELQQSLDNLLSATPDMPVLLPVRPDPVPPKPEPPKPEPPSTKYPAAKPYRKVAMDVTFYEHINYQGRSWKFSSDQPGVGDWNDQFSSMRVPAGATVTLFEHANFGGKSLAVTSDVPDMRTIGWNDSVSSVKIAGGGAGGKTVRLKQDKHYIECVGTAIGASLTANEAGKVKLTDHGSYYDALFVKENKQLSIQADGSLQSRPAGTDGPYEQLQCTSQPKPAEIDILYRVSSDVLLGGTVLQIVEGD